MTPYMQDERLHPWRWARSLEPCWLFWMPVSPGAIPESQKEWLLQFFERFSSSEKILGEVQEEHFMELKTIDADASLKHSFLNGVLKESPITGFSRFPNQEYNPPPTPKEAKAFADKKLTFNPYKYSPDRACWFVGGNGLHLRKKYLGYGGMTMLVVKPQLERPKTPPPRFNGSLIIPKVYRDDRRLKPLLESFDPNNPTKIPPFIEEHPGMAKVFSLFDVNAVRSRPERMNSPFRDKSKELFGEGMERDLVFEAQPFILPRLSSAHFFSHTPEQVRRWFELCDVYVAESPVDGGIIMACKDNLTMLIADITDGMRSEGYHYWES